jgi:hypothetical protein
MWAKKRMGHEEARSTPKLLAAHLTAVAAAFFVLFVWFRAVPAVWSSLYQEAPEIPTPHGFALLSASLHAMLVGFGLYLGSDAALIRGPWTRFGALASAVALAFVVQCSALAICYQLQLGYTTTFFDTKLAFVAAGAISLTLPAAIACTVPLWNVGVALLQSSKLHCLLITIALAIHLSQDATVLGSGSATAVAAAFFVVRSHPAGKEPKRLSSL